MNRIRLQRRWYVFSRGDLPGLIVLAAVALWFFGPLLTRERLFRTHEWVFTHLRSIQYLLEFQNGFIPPLHLAESNVQAGMAFPLFYPPLAYYITALIQAFGINVATAIHLTLFLSVVLSGWAFYYLAKFLTRNRLIAIAVAILYISFPYRFQVVFVRGALAESWVYVWYPLILLGIFRAFRLGRPPWYLPFVIAGAILTHTLMALWFGTLCGLLCLALLFRRQFPSFLSLALSACIGILISMFYLLPSQWYINDVWVSQSGYFAPHIHEYRVHLFQFFSQSPNDWMGRARTGPTDTMNYSLGGPTLLALLLVVYHLATARTRPRLRRLLGNDRIVAAVFSGLGIIALILFMRSPASFLGILPSAYEYIQFPWRLLSITGLLSCILIALLLAPLARASGNPRWLGIAAIALAVTFFSPSYHQWTWMDDPAVEELNVEFIRSQSRMMGETGLGEYLPLDYPVKEALQEPPPPPGYVAPQAGVIEQWERIDYSRWLLRVKGHEAGRVRVPLIRYDYWLVRDQNGEEAPMGSEKGFIAITVPQGESTWTIERRTPRVVKIGLWFSAFGLLLAIMLPLGSRRRRP